MPIREIRHPLIRHKLGLMRRADISTKNFRELAQEVGALLTYEATKDLPLENYEIPGWAGPVQVEKIAGKKITVVPILRAGIGMLDGVLSLIPGAKVSAVGVARNEQTLEAHTYLEKLVPEIDERLALIIDPMLARRAGITLPVSAGVMPIVKRSQIERTVALSSASLPSEFTRMISRYQDDPESLYAAGIDYAVQQLRDLIEGGADGVHLYAMNDAKVAAAVYEGIKDLL